MIASNGVARVCRGRSGGGRGSRLRGTAAQDAERGQALISFALLLGAMMAMVALVIDGGLLAAQHVFNQTAADSAAAGAAHLLVTSVSDAPDGGVYFAVRDADVYAEVRRYGGLSSTGGSAVATGVNRGPGAAARTTLAITLEYWDGARWCASPQAPGPTSGAPACATRYLGIYPPQPAADRYFKVRVGVHAATVSLFPQLGAGGNGSCLRPTGGAGRLSCASSVMMVGGPCPPCTIARES
jgi:Flp pilus assembly protein TadG